MMAEFFTLCELQYTFVPGASLIKWRPVHWAELTDVERSLNISENKVKTKANVNEIWSI